MWFMHRQIYALLVRILDVLQDVRTESRQTNAYLKAILNPTPTGFRIFAQRIEDKMDLQIFDDGKGVKFTAEPVNKAGKQVTLPTGVVPQWASSNPAVLTVAADPNDPSGLTAIGTPVSDGTGVTASVSATLPDGTVIKDDGSEAPIDVVPDTQATGFIIQEAAQ